MIVIYTALALLNVLLVVLLFLTRPKQPTFTFSTVLNEGVHIGELNKVRPESAPKTKIEPADLLTVTYKIPENAQWKYRYTLEDRSVCDVYTDSEDYIVGHYWKYAQ